MPGHWRKPRFERDSAGSALRVKGGDWVRGLNACFKGAHEISGFGFAAEGYRMLVQADLPLGFCQFFYQDLHN